ncbi:MAG: nucleotidyltransferase domain-containing protein [bacterium]|nr:nucleotidyltransferase domain-containing protein [bacterium]
MGGALPPVEAEVGPAAESPPVAAGPTVADAVAAAQVLVAEGTEEVLLYGSVARGDADAGSDIDLVAIFADIDYTQRHVIRHRLESQAAAAVAWPVQVVVTDRPEWHNRSTEVSASFERVVRADAVQLATNGVYSEPNWHKMMATPMNNPEEALKYFIDKVLTRLSGLSTNAQAVWPETDDRKPASAREAARLRRMVRVCEDSAVAVELCLKALAILHGVYPPSEKELRDAGHNIRLCLELIPENPRREAERLIRQRNLDLHTTSTWRTLSTYPDNIDVIRASADKQVTDYVATALAVCEHSFAEIRRAVGDTPALRRAADEWHDQERFVTGQDIRTGLPR